jgi:hypothetical protein
MEVSIWGKKRPNLKKIKGQQSEKVNCGKMVVHSGFRAG